MALFRKNPFISAVKQYQFYEAFQHYLVNEDECEEDLQALQKKDRAAARDFSEYLEVWNRFRQAVIEGDFDTVDETVSQMDASDMYTRSDLKQVLVDLADKTSNYNCFTVYWKYLEDKEDIDELDQVVNMLLECLPDCPPAYDQALDLLQQMVDSTDKIREKLPYLERALSVFERGNCKVDIERCAKFIAQVKEINPKSPAARKAEMALYRTDMVALGGVRPLIDAGELQQAVDTLLEQSRDLPRRIATRGVTGNWKDAETFYRLGCCLYQTTNDPTDAFYIASSVWHSDLRENEAILNESMTLGLEALEHFPENVPYMQTMLDQLYLVRPFPLPDETAKAYCEKVLALDPENEIATECMKIYHEQQEEKLLEDGEN